MNWKVSFVFKYIGEKGWEKKFVVIFGGWGSVLYWLCYEINVFEECV